MSNSLAIAAVTATLRQLIFKAVAPAGATTVTTLPLDRAATKGGGRRVNLYLYQVSPNAALRNMAIPSRTRRGEVGAVPLAINLHYLITVYGDGDSDAQDMNESDHHLLGLALTALHDSPVLDRNRIRNATEPVDTTALKSDLHEQVEQVKLTMTMLTLEEMSKLWATFQTQHRLSAAYEASVVLLEGRNLTPSPLPVLRRGPDDRGPSVDPSLPPILERIEYRYEDLRRPMLPAALLDPEDGPVIAIVHGMRMPLQGATVVIRDPRLDGDASAFPTDLLTLQPQEGSTREELRLRLDPRDQRWVAGQLAARIEYPAAVDGRRRFSDPIPFHVSPRLIKSGGLLSYLTVVEAGRRKLVLYVEPPLAPERRAWLLLTGMDQAHSQRPIPADRDSPNNTPNTPVFDVQNIPPGRYLVRLRVDLVDSLILRRTPAGSIELDDEQGVVL